MNVEKSKQLMRVLSRYKKFCTQEVMDLIVDCAQKLAEKHIVFISSTYQGGGVAEMLNSLIFLFNELSVKVGWRILHGTVDFFVVTKKLHNALQGEHINLSQRKKFLYIESNKRFSVYTHLEEHDLVVVHDPQPLPLIDFYQKAQPWLFRCHIDTTKSDPATWSYLKSFMEKYDRIIASRKEYARDLKIPNTVIHPAIDPLSMKNRYLAPGSISKVLAKYGIATEKPIITQISRFDKWKDPVGVIKIFEKVRARYDCKLVLLGSFANDDPEGSAVYEKTRKAAERSKFKKDIQVLLINSDILVNSLQRQAAVVIQKSIKEGFGLVVAEALFKGTPVVGSNVGGIPLQIIDGFNGYLLNPKDVSGFADKIIMLLRNGDLRAKLGKNGIEHIKSHFLITRLLLDWLKLFVEVAR